MVDTQSRAVKPASGRAVRACEGRKAVTRSLRYPTTDRPSQGLARRRAGRTATVLT